MIKSTQNNNLRFFPKEFTHIFKNYNFWLQLLQIEAFQQRYSKCKWEIPYLEGEFNPKTCKNWKMSSKKFFLSGLDQKKLKLYVFEMDFMTNQLKLTVPKKCGFRSWKGSNIWTLFYKKCRWQTEHQSSRGLQQRCVSW